MTSPARASGRPAEAEPGLADHGLHIDQDLDFFRRFWKFERVMWVLMALVVLAALSGVLGRGPLSRTTLVRPLLTVEYERFLRHEVPTSLLITLQREHPGERALELVIDQHLVERFKVRDVHPEPPGITYQRGGTRYSFPVEAGEQQVTVRFDLEPEGFGMQETRLWRGGGPPSVLRQWVWP